MVSQNNLACFSKFAAVRAVAGDAVVVRLGKGDNTQLQSQVDHSLTLQVMEAAKCLPLKTYQQPYGLQLSSAEGYSYCGLAI